MPTEPTPVSLFEVAKRAVHVADPTDTNASLGDLLMEFEDDDEPVRAVVDGLDRRVAEAVARIDPEIEDPAVSIAAAMILYLAHRRDELHDEPEKILRLAARAEWKGDPPTAVREWLAERGVEV
jgi:putative intracellular protease/amidase